jgi:hypothetical protein
VSGQGGDDLLFRCLAADVAVSSESSWVPLAVHDIAQDAQAGGPGEVADYQMELQIHLEQCFLDPIHHRNRVAHQGFSMAEVAPQRGNVGGRSKTPT